jgi:pimeloyl-ACP methyl ester carboxylesterase
VSLGDVVNRFEFGDVELTYEIRGHGDPVVVLHANAFARWYEPLIEHLPMVSVLHYRRRLRADAGGDFRALTAPEDAVICAQLMAHVGWPTAHIVGHSYGGLVALSLALDEPKRVRSLALLEPALVRDMPNAEQVAAGLQRFRDAYSGGDKAGAMDAFLRAVCGDDYRAALERTVPGAFDDAVAETDLFFQVEMPATQGWSFGPSGIRRIAQPILDVVGAESPPRFAERSEVLRSWLPQAEHFRLPHAGHLLMVENPTAMAQELSRFFSRHAATELSRPPLTG